MEILTLGYFWCRCSMCNKRQRWHKKNLNNYFYEHFFLSLLFSSLFSSVCIPKENGKSTVFGMEERTYPRVVRITFIPFFSSFIRFPYFPYLSSFFFMLSSILSFAQSVCFCLCMHKMIMRERPSKIFSCIALKSNIIIVHCSTECQCL